MTDYIKAFVLIGLLVMTQSCYNDHPPQALPFDCNDVSFSTHVLPIFENSCATSGCHDGSRVPDLRNENAWNELRSGGFFNVLVPEQSSLYRSVDFTGDPMPPGGPKISQLNIDLIFCWISDGAQND